MNAREVLVSIGMAVGVGLATAGAATIAFAGSSETPAATAPLAADAHTAPQAKRPEGGKHRGSATHVAGVALAAR